MVLANTHVRIDFLRYDPDQAWAALSATAAEGVMAYDMTQCFALLAYNERVLYELNRKQAVAGSYTLTHVDGIRNAAFSGLTRVPMKGEPLGESHISFDGVTSHGKVFGWAHAPDNAPIKLSLSVDDVLVETIYPDKFRMDLLQTNVGMGCGGFSTRLPDEYLDGNSHEIKLELYRRDDPYKKRIAYKMQRKKLPFHFNLPRPWIVSGRAHAVAWTLENEEEYLEIRHNILAGTVETGLARAADFITRHPSAAFKDFGLSDRYRIEGLKFPSFGKRVTHRWGKLFGAEPCEKGDACCKQMNLPYNATQPTGPGKDTVMPDTWEKGGFLDTCPLKIRHFASKELTQKYAAQYGIHTPMLYGVIKSIGEFDAFDFPDQYVLKPDFASGIALYLMQGDLNLFDGFRYSMDTIRKHVAAYLENNRGSYFIVEEFLCQDVAQKDQPIIPLDYKIHCFGNRARLIHIDDKNAISFDPLHRRQSWLARDWGHAPYSMRSAVEHPNGPVAKPKDLNVMYDLADEIAKDLGDYVRVDMYATTQGPVLGEISSFTHAGLGFTNYGETVLGQCWEIFDAAPT